MSSCPLCTLTGFTQETINHHLDSVHFAARPDPSITAVAEPVYPLFRKKSDHTSASSSQSQPIEHIPTHKNNIPDATHHSETHAQTIHPLQATSLKRKRKLPLPERLRPTSLDQVQGHKDIIQTIKTLIEHDQWQSMIFWGPPGSGKTSIARIIGQEPNVQFHALSATANSTADCKKIFQKAESTSQRTVLFLDEVHRFSKAQQDIFLPYVENGTIILLACTTENPSFRVQSALLSRCRIFVLNRLTADDIKEIITRGLGTLEVSLEPSLIQYLADMCDGDSRIALNALDMAIALSPEGSCDLQTIKNALQRSHLVYNKGDERYDLISAWHKSTRGSDANAALYYLGRMLEGGEDPLYVARRMVVCASEDIGLADNQALPLALAAYQSCQVIGMPECDIILAHCAVYLAEAPKSTRAYKAYKNVKARIRTDPSYPVPMHIRNAPTKLMRDLGYGQDYKYNPDHTPEELVDQTYMPQGIADVKFLDT